MFFSLTPAAPQIAVSRLEGHKSLTWWVGVQGFAVQCAPADSQIAVSSLEQAHATLELECVRGFAVRTTLLSNNPLIHHELLKHVVTIKYTTNLWKHKTDREQAAVQLHTRRAARRSPKFPTVAQVLETADVVASGQRRAGLCKVAISG